MSGIDCTTEDCTGDAFTFEAIVSLWETISPYWDTFLEFYNESVDPIIKQYGEYGLAGALATFSVGNMVYTFLNSTGTSQIATFFTMARSIIADIPLGDSLSLYDVFDWIIDVTSNVEGDEETTETKK